MAKLIYLFALILSVAFARDLVVTEEAWFDVEVKDMEGPGEDYKGRFVVALFGEVVPMTVMNFAAIVRGYKRGKENLHYKNTPIHRIVPDFVIQMGDITTGDGTGGRSIYGERFNDENFELSHKSAGWVSMANHGKDTNGSQFFILLNRARWLDGKHVVFGKVIKGMDVIHTIGEVSSNPDTAVPRRKVRITDCGLREMSKKWTLTHEQGKSNNDIE